MIELTAAGIDEANRLRTPMWWRWAKDRASVKTIVLAAITSVITTLVTGILGNLVKRWMGTP